MIASVSTAARESFFSTVFCSDINLDRFSEVLKDHFFEIQTKLIPLFEYIFCNFSKIFWTLIFFDTLDSIVSISSGSDAAKIIASTSLSPSLKLPGKLTILVFFLILFIFFFYKNIIK